MKDRQNMLIETQTGLVDTAVQSAKDKREFLGQLSTPKSTSTPTASAAASAEKSTKVAEKIMTSKE